MEQNQIFHMPKPQLNTFDYEHPGETSVDDFGVSRFLGQVGRFVHAQSKSSQLKFDSVVGTLHGGTYQLVKVAASPAVAILRGHLAYWVDPIAGFEVDTDTTAEGWVAGVFLNTVTGGNYTFIQVSGIASILFLADITQDGAADANKGRIVSAAANSRADILADATAVTQASARLLIGRAVTSPIDVAITGAVYPVYLTLVNRVF